MLEISRELEERYMNVQSGTSEMEVLGKIVEECGELLGEVGGLMVEVSGGKVGSWKGKDKNYRKEVMDEFADLYRMMGVWLKKFASEEEIRDMEEVNENKIKKYVEKKEKK